MFKELHATYGPRGLTLLAVSDEDAKTVRTFVEKEGIPWQNLLDADGKIAEQFGGVLGLPMAFLLDGEGKVVAQFSGLVPRGVLEPKIKELLDRAGGA
jgi:peroxiredoxin